MIERAWMEGVYDGVRTDTDMHHRQAASIVPLTFYDG